MTYIETRLLGKAQLTIDVIHKIKKSDSFPPIKTALLGKTQLTILIAHRSKSCCRLKLKTKHSFSNFLYFIKYSSFRRDWGKGKDTTIKVPNRTTLHQLRWPNTVFARAFADVIQRAHKDCKNKNVVNRAIILFIQNPHFLRYFSLLLNEVY